MKEKLESAALMVVVISFIIVGIWRAVGGFSWRTASTTVPTRQEVYEPVVGPSEGKPQLQIPRAPSQLPALPNGHSWEELLRDGVNEFTSDYYGDKAVATAYGALQTSNPTVVSIMGGDRFWEEPALRRGAAASPRAVRAVFRSGILRRAVYGWAMPLVQQAFRQMSAGQQEEYLRVLKHAENYLQAFDYVREVGYFDGLSRGRCQSPEWLEAHHLRLPWWYKEADTVGGGNCLTLFTRFDSRGKESPYRKVEAFCFRRFNADGVGPRTQLYWIRRVIADLRAVQ